MYHLLHLKFSTQSLKDNCACLTETPELLKLNVHGRKVNFKCKNTILAKCLSLKNPFSIFRYFHHNLETPKSQCPGTATCTNTCEHNTCAHGCHLASALTVPGPHASHTPWLFKNLSCNLISQLCSVSGQLKFRA